jgi:hypothetical protein
MKQSCRISKDGMARESAETSETSVVRQSAAGDPRSNERGILELIGEMFSNI